MEESYQLKLYANEMHEEHKKIASNIVVNLNKEQLSIMEAKEILKYCLLLVELSPMVVEL